MLTKIVWQFGFLAASAMIGCAAPTDVAGDPNQTTADEFSLAAGPWGYFRISATSIDDCAPPACSNDDDGGVFIQALNLDETPCADGTSAPECFVRDIGFTDANVPQETQERFLTMLHEGHGVAEGWIAMAEGKNGPEPWLFVSQAWVGAVPEQITAPVFQVEPVALMCVRAPCPTHSAGVANTGDMELIEGVNLYATGVAEEYVTLGYSELAKRSILVAGEIVEQGDEQSRGLHDRHQPLPGSHILAAQNFFTMLLE